MDGPKDLAFYIDAFADLDVPVPVANTRDVAQERRRIDEYLGTLDTLDLLKNLAATHPPMDAGARAVVLLPARFEANRIGRFFDALDQDLRTFAAPGDRTVEVIVLNNWRAGEEPDDTAEIVRRQASQYNLPYRLLYIERVWQPDEAYYPLARARKLLADYALYRAAQRRHWTGPLYLFSEDADVEAIEPGRTFKMIRYMDAHPTLDGLRGVQERTLAVMARNHLLLFERRSWFFTEALLSQQRYHPAHFDHANFYWHRVVTGGWNTCFTASVYALIRGYTPNVRIFEDMDLGQRISVVRGRWRGDRFIPDVSTVRRAPYRAVSNAARALLALIQKRHIYDDSNAFSFFFDKAYEAQVRNADLEALLEALATKAEINSGNVHRFERVCSDLLAETRRIFGGRDEALTVFARALWLTGLRQRDIRVGPDDTVEILNHASFLDKARLFSDRVARTGLLHQESA